MNRFITQIRSQAFKTFGRVLQIHSRPFFFFLNLKSLTKCLKGLATCSKTNTRPTFFSKRISKILICKRRHIYWNLTKLIFVILITVAVFSWDTKTVTSQLVTLVTHVKISKFWLNNTISDKKERRGSQFNQTRCFLPFRKVLQ